MIRQDKIHFFLPCREIKRVTAAEKYKKYLNSGVYRKKYCLYCPKIKSQFWEEIHSYRFILKIIQLTYGHIYTYAFMQVHILLHVHTPTCLYTHLYIMVCRVFDLALLWKKRQNTCQSWLIKLIYYETCHRRYNILVI